MNRNTCLALVALSGSSVTTFACSSDPVSNPYGNPVGGGAVAPRGGAGGGVNAASGGSTILPGSGGVIGAGGISAASGGASGGTPANGSGGAAGFGGSNSAGGSAGGPSGGTAAGGQSNPGAGGGTTAGGKAASGGSASVAGRPGSGGGGSITPGKGGASGTAGSGKGGSSTGGPATGGQSATGGAGGSGKGGSSTGGAAAGGQSNDRCDVGVYNASTPPKALTLTGNLGTHDPVVIFAHSQYYLFQTGDGIGAKTSANLTAWQATPVLFGSNPAWVAQQVPGATNLWAPDISYFGGMYHIYYSASTFGSNRSCIGHATRAALNSGSWTDHGSVVCSNATGTGDNWNAIDPNVVVDQAGTPWLSFGSFWGGLKLVQLNSTGARANTTLHSIAARPNAGGALEAPFIVRRCGYYYLFASFDACCQGVNSTYKIMVGRSASVTGPYVDKQGTAMMQGGGTLLVQSDTRWKGPGHNAVIFTDTGAFNVYHSYDANSNGNATLRISEIAWDTDGWPVSGGP